MPALVSAVLILTGCGGGGSSGLSRSALITKVDAICKHRNEIITAAASKVLAGGHLPTPAAFGKLAHQTIIPQYRAQIAELSALKPSAQIAPQYTTWLRESRATLARMELNPRTITSSASFITVNREAGSLGFASSCHVGPG